MSKHAVLRASSKTSFSSVAARITLVSSKGHNLSSEQGVSAVHEIPMRARSSAHPLNSPKYRGVDEQNSPHRQDCMKNIHVPVK